MTIEDIKDFIYENKKGLIVGAVVALLLRGMLK